MVRRAPPQSSRRRVRHMSCQERAHVDESQDFHYGEDNPSNGEDNPQRHKFWQASGQTWQVLSTAKIRKPNRAATNLSSYWQYNSLTRPSA